MTSVPNATATRRCATFGCPEPASWQRVWQSPWMSPAVIDALCLGCAARAREFEHSHPDFNPARYERLEP